MVWVCLEYHIGQRRQCPPSSKWGTKASFNLDDLNHRQALSLTAACIYLLRASEIDDDWGIDEAPLTPSARPRLLQIIPFNPKIFMTFASIRKHYPLPSILTLIPIQWGGHHQFLGLQTHNYWDIFMFNTFYLSSPHSNSTETLYLLIWPFL